MVFADNSLPIPNWQNALVKTGEPTSEDSFISKMKELNLANSIFVDCTANDAIAARYEEILSSSISIVTPNKKANSGSYLQYQTLKERAQKANVKFYYAVNPNVIDQFVWNVNGSNILALLAITHPTVLLRGILKRRTYQTYHTVC